MITTALLVAAAILVPVGLVLAALVVAGLIIAAAGSGEHGITRPQSPR